METTSLEKGITINEMIEFRDGRPIKSLQKIGFSFEDRPPCLILPCGVTIRYKGRFCASIFSISELRTFAEGLMAANDLIKENRINDLQEISI